MPNLKDALQAAYDEPAALHSCSHFCWFAIRAFVPTQPYLVANELVRQLARAADAWQEIDSSESRRMASLATAGTLIIGGREDTPNGHVIAVYPGEPKESGGYAYTDKKSGKTRILRSHGLFARCMSRSIGSWPGAKSDGDKTIWDPWAGDAFDDVRFWILTSSQAPT